MKRFLLALLCLALPLAAQERFLDAPRPAGDGPRLVVFNPVAHNLRGLMVLREKGILAVPGLTVIGVYHDKQRGNFEESRRLVRERKLDWFKFHVVSAPIGPADLWRRNACSPEFEAILQKADGVIFFGGPDIPSSLFGQKTSLLAEIEDPWRHWLELSAIFHFLGGSQDPGQRPLLASRAGFPILGICLGFQSLNVGTGGDLVQDIWMDLYGKRTLEDAIALGPEQWHNNPYKRLHPTDGLMTYSFHSLQLMDGLFTRELGFKAGDHPRVLSSHHQALGKLGQSWKVIATSRDGKVVEAIEHMAFRNVLGIQFHPEHPQLWDPAPFTRVQPGDPLTSYRAILEGTPPSVEFNQAVWRWLGKKLVESRGR